MTVHLKQDEPDTSNRLDGMKQGVIGQPISRVEGLAKVTGTAPYAAEYPIEGCVEGVLATATITRGEILKIDKDSVLGMPGATAYCGFHQVLKRLILTALIDEAGQLVGVPQPLELGLGEGALRALSALKP